MIAGVVRVPRNAPDLHLRSLFGALSEPMQAPTESSVKTRAPLPAQGNRNYWVRVERKQIQKRK
jgi:hypothetical protein